MADPGFPRRWALIPAYCLVNFFPENCMKMKEIGLNRFVRPQITHLKFIIEAQKYIYVPQNDVHWDAPLVHNMTIIHLVSEVQLIAGSCLRLTWTE